MSVSWPSALPSATYAVVVTVEAAAATVGQYQVGVVPASKTTTGCQVVIRSTAAVTAGAAPNLSVIAVA